MQHHHVHRVGVVAAVDAVGIGHHAEIGTPAAAGAVLKQHVGMLLVQVLPDGQQILRVADGQALLLLVGRVRPAVFGDVAVHVPFEVVQLTGVDQVVQPGDGPVADLVPGQIQHQLIPLQNAGPGGAVDHPVGMRPVQVAVRVDHFRLHPQAEQHAFVMAGLGNGLQSMGEALRVGHPVAQTGLIVDAPGHPAVVDDEQLHAQRRAFVDQGQTVVLPHVEFIGIPRIVDDGPFGVSLVDLFAPGHQMIELPVVEDLAHALEAAVGEARGEQRRFEALARLQGIFRVEAVHAAGDGDQLAELALHGDVKIAAPMQHAEEHMAAFLGGRAVLIQREEGNLLGGGAGDTVVLQHSAGLRQHELIFGVLAAPVAGEMGQTVIPAQGQLPRGALHLLQLQRAVLAVADHQPLAQKRQIGPAPVMKLHGHGIGRVLGDNGQMVVVDGVTFIYQPQAAGAVGMTDPQHRVAVVAGLHGGQLGNAVLEKVYALGGHISAQRRFSQRQQRRIAAQRRAPVQVPQAAVGGNAEGIGHFGRGKMEKAVLRIKLNVHWNSSLHFLP